MSASNSAAAALPEAANNDASTNETPTDEPLIGEVQPAEKSEEQQQKKPATKPDGVAEEGAADAGVAVLSEEQTNAALAALQEASTLVMVEENEKKRKTPEEEEESGAKPPAKRRSSPMRVSWEDRLEMLRAYKRKHGNLLIPIRYKQDPSLGKFVHNTREQYKLYHHKTKAGYKKKCSLTAERIQQLEEIGFVFSTERTKRQNDDWETRFEQLKRYKEKHGHCLVPHGYKEDPSFAEWIHRQRTTNASSRKGTPNPLVEERMKKLESIGFVFTVQYVST